MIGTGRIGKGCLAAVAVAAAFLGWASPASAQKPHVDKERGYRIVIPKGYERAEPFSFRFGDETPDELREGRHELELFSKGDFSPYRIRCFYFPERTDAEVEARKEGGAVTGRIYRTFQEYAKDRIRGFFFSKERSMRLAGFPGAYYEMSFEKRREWPEKWMACAMQIPGGEFAVMFESDEKNFDKLRSDFLRCAQSFRLLDSDEGIRWMRPGEVDRSKPGESEGNKESRKTMTPEDLAKWKDMRREEIYKEKIKKLDKGWSHLRVGDILILTEEDRKYTQSIAKHVKAVNAWLDKRFGDVQFHHEPEPPYRTSGGVIRINKLQDGAIGLGISSGGEGIGELAFTRTDWGRINFEMLNRFLLDEWLDARHPNLSSNLPGWLQVGLEALIETATLKGSRVEFPFDPDGLKYRWSWDARGVMRDEVEFDSWIALEALLLKPYGEITRDSRANSEAVCFVRYLFEGPGRKKATTRSLVTNYVSDLSLVLTMRDREKRDEAKKLAEAGKSKKKLTEEELLEREDEEYKKRRAESGGKEDIEVAKRIASRTFKGWDEDEWKSLDRSVARYVSAVLK